MERANLLAILTVAAATCPFDNPRFPRPGAQARTPSGTVSEMNPSETEPERGSEPGVGPHPEPWPDDPRLDPALLAEGDRRNVVDRFRYWSMEAIVADLDQSRYPFHVATENWVKDLNLGSIVRSANAFAVASVHIVGQKRWNRRGAMVTDRYQHLHHHPDVASLALWAEAANLPIIGVDNIPGAIPIETRGLPRECVLLFGQEGPGLSPEAQQVCRKVVEITQFGSTRSINASAAAAIVMHSWIRQHALNST